MAPGKDKLKILACPANEGGCSYYRIILPMRKLQEMYPDEVEVRVDLNPLGYDKEAMEKNIAASGDSKIMIKEDWNDSDFEWADVVFTQNLHNFGAQYTMDIFEKAERHGCLTHYDNDDLLTELYTGHRLFDVYKENNLSDATKHIYSRVDMVSVTQRKFAERIAPYVGRALVIIKNAIDYTLPSWNAPPVPGHKKVTRFGWVGGIHHEEDVKEIPGVALGVNNKAGAERVHWGFYGRPPMPMEEGKPAPDWQQEVWDNYEKTLSRGIKHKNYSVYGALPGDNYGVLYSNIDVAIAPLQFNAFNDSKSEIKVAECGRYGIPLVATDCGCYDETIVNGETGFLISPDNPRSAWVKVLTKCAKDKLMVREMGANLKRITDQAFDINKNIRGRLDMYREIIETKEKFLATMKKDTPKSQGNQFIPPPLQHMPTK